MNNSDKIVMIMLIILIVFLTCKAIILYFAMRRLTSIKIYPTTN